MKKSLMQPVTATWPGRPFPLGATWDGRGVNFALFSEHAEKVELCLFDDSGGGGKYNAYRLVNARTRYGIATCRKRVPAHCTGIACMDPISLIRDTGLTRISCCLTRTRVI